MDKVIKFKKENKEVILPCYAHPDDAGMDIFSFEEKTLLPHSWDIIKTGFSIELPHGFEAQIRSKSGLTLKSGLIVLNSPGTIDENYRGEVCVILMNVSSTSYKIKKHQKIAQMVINKVYHFPVLEVKETSKTSRGKGGFGSTGLKKK